ncbi:MAG: NAD-dependent epimerase/dehydratase family protein, partial [Candidatus Altiarchaeota archaeon]|nr:NAD-dependent epimerase/dehydratase family protein [Candidatus Altiarchaeota archaeon]
MKKILVTGSSGFVGKNLVQHLNGRYKVFAPAHRELELLDSEKIADYIASHDIDLIVHCASVGGSRKTGYDIGKTDVASTNLGMFHNLAKCIKDDMLMIHLGSGAEYSRPHWKPKMPETYFGSHVPEDPYGHSKYLMSKEVEKAENIICLRIFGLYGKYEDYTFKFISNAIVKNLLK